MININWLQMSLRTKITAYITFDRLSNNIREDYQLVFDATQTTFVGLDPSQNYTVLVTPYNFLNDSSFPFGSVAIITSKIK